MVISIFGKIYWIQNQCPAMSITRVTAGLILIIEYVCAENKYLGHDSLTCISNYIPQNTVVCKYLSMYWIAAFDVCNFCNCHLACVKKVS